MRSPCCLCICRCIPSPLYMLGSGFINTFPRQRICNNRRIVGRIVCYAFRIVSKESRRFTWTSRFFNLSFNDCVSSLQLMVENWQGNWSTGRKPALMSLFSPQISYDLTWDPIRVSTVGSESVLWSYLLFYYYLFNLQMGFYPVAVVQ
jgi:hypothetical protein